MSPGLSPTVLGSGHGALGSWSYHEVGESEVIQRVLQAAPLLLRVPAAIGEAKAADGLFQPCNGVVIVTCFIGHLQGSAGVLRAAAGSAWPFSCPIPSHHHLNSFCSNPPHPHCSQSHRSPHSSSCIQSHPRPYPHSVLSSLLSPFCPIPSYLFSSQSISLLPHHVFISSPSHLHLHPLSYP